MFVVFFFNFFVDFLVLMFTDTPFLCKFMSMLGLSYHVHKQCLSIEDPRVLNQWTVFSFIFLE